MKICKKCSKEKSINDFRLAWFKGNSWVRGMCKICENEARHLRDGTKPKEYKVYRVSQKKDYAASEKGKAAFKRAREKLKLKPQEFRILANCIKNDRKRGFPNPDLTLEWIADLIKNGCCYCGEETLKMSLDRIDNSKGHQKNNVNPACVRCNYLRTSLPIEAWNCLIPGLRLARSLNLFNGWTGETKK